MRLQLKAIPGQVIVITGASSGIGLVTARMAAAQGAHVMLVSRDAQTLSDIVLDIQARGQSADFAVADVGVREQVEAAAARTSARFGRIDSWVNCAGVAIYAKLADTPEDEHKRLFQTNYFGVVNGALAALPYLRREGGALITVGSIASDMPSPIMGAYSASKHAAKAYIESLRIELNAEGAPISVTLIKPSGIDTPIAHHAARHIHGKPVIPPPAYDPHLVAEAILDAMVHPRLNVVVGGAGQFQVLIATHFPGMFARFGGAVMPLLAEENEEAPRRNNLSRPVGDRQERSGDTLGRKHSLYTDGQRHARVSVVTVTGALVALFVMKRRMRRTAR